MKYWWVLVDDFVLFKVGILVFVLDCVCCLIYCFWLVVSLIVLLLVLCTFLCVLNLVVDLHRLDFSCWLLVLVTFLNCLFAFAWFFALGWFNSFVLDFNVFVCCFEYLFVGYLFSVFVLRGCVIVCTRWFIWLFWMFVWFVYFVLIWMF